MRSCLTSGLWTTAFGGARRRSVAARDRRHRESAVRERRLDASGKYAVGLAVLILAGLAYPAAVDAWVPIHRAAEAGVLIGLVFGVPKLVSLGSCALTERWPWLVTAGVLWWALGLNLVLITAYGGRSSETRADARAWDQTYPGLTVNAAITLAVCAALFVGAFVYDHHRNSRRSARRYTR